MTNFNREYNATRIRTKVSIGSSMPSIDEIVLDKLKSSEIELKLEEIIEHVGLQIKIGVDDSIRGAVSGALKNLKMKNIIINTKYGYWQYIK